MKPLSSSLLLSVAMLALPASGAAAGTPLCGAVQAAGLSLPDRHVAAKLAAEAALDRAAGGCEDSAVRVMAETAGSGAPLQLHDPDAPLAPAQGPAPVPAPPAAAPEVLRELPAEVFVHRAQVAPMATPAAFTGILPLLPVLGLLPTHC
ncbi:hypothetical protein [Cupriavidus necator]|uniref:hypothetical protein n=1 Tax=Cupriavidus necator TaxID=106590 RepID=UPI00277F6F68|nr:hypothetical protein [Cupriavidus necator]MDQ0140648.1 hypothetical protein [Cupriavidus necator]